jgi:hypothetical protein
MEQLLRIEEILSDYKGRGAEFKATVDMLCNKGIPNGCFQDYKMLKDILVILSLCEVIVGK